MSQLRFTGFFIVSINEGKMIDYQGERRKSDIIEFVSRADSPRVTRTTSKAGFDTAIQNNKHFFLLVSEGKDEQARLVVN